MTQRDELKTGTVLRYPFLWSREHEKGEEEGRKPRPVAVAFKIGSKIGLVPITTQPPASGEAGIEIPIGEKSRASLDITLRLWVIPDEINIDDPAESYYIEPDSVLGQFSTAFMERIKAEIRKAIGQLRQVPRR